jgi:hypothetical protein
LIGNEFVEVGIGEPAARAFCPVTDGDIFERAGSDVAVQRLDRAAELGGGLRNSFESVR